MGLGGLVVINSPWISEKYVVGHVLADRGEADASLDTQLFELGWVADSREHQKLWGVENTRAQNDLFAGGHLPPLTLCIVNTRMLAVGLMGLLEGPVPNSTPLNLGVVVLQLVASRSFVAWA